MLQPKKSITISGYNLISQTISIFHKDHLISRYTIIEFYHNTKIDFLHKVPFFNTYRKLLHRR